MKHLLVLTVFLAVFSREELNAQSAYTFTKVKENAAGATEDQCKTGTCWSFATISFLESEILRKTGKPVDLSEMFNVYYTYQHKTWNYIRYQGKQQYGPGGLSHDALSVVANYGMVPEKNYSGLDPNETVHDHGAMDVLLQSAADAVLKNQLNTSGETWRKSIIGILDANLGKVPENFEFEGKKYTPQSFRDAMKIDATEYVSITSFAHHPFYSTFVLEVPDNWSHGSFYNIPLDELKQVADYALEQGYTISWDADVSEPGFSFQQGMAILPKKGTPKEKLFKEVVTEETVTQSARQTAFERFETTDDHLMHITGKAKDQHGTNYYFTKNSWGTNNPNNGYQYISENYFLMKTVGIVVHKNAIPESIKKKLRIQ